MDFKLKEFHLTFFFILLMIVFTLSGSLGLSLAALVILAFGISIVIPIRDHFLVINPNELEKLKEEINTMKLELNALKMQSGIKTIR